MELRVLRYFLAVAREESISEAAEVLHVTQPTLSRQLMDLEDELGVQLFERARRSRRIALTEAGIFLRRQAEEIVLLADKTEAAFSTSAGEIAGDVYVAAGETEAVRLLSRAAGLLQKEFPQIRYHITSGDGLYMEEQLDKGLADFGLMLGPVNPDKFEVFVLPHRDAWGVLMQKSSPLAAQEAVRNTDLWSRPLILSRQSISSGHILKWLGREMAELNIVGDYSLAYNASLMTEEGLGYTLTLDGLINTSGDSPLCFRPLDPPLELEARLVWKKHQPFSRAAELYLKRLQTMCAEQAAQPDRI